MMKFDEAYGEWMIVTKARRRSSKQVADSSVKAAPPAGREDP